MINPRLARSKYSCSLASPWLRLYFVAASRSVPGSGTLAGTQPLTWEGDLSARMVEDLHKFADRETAASVERRARYWRRDFSSPQATTKASRRIGPAWPSI